MSNRLEKLSADEKLDLIAAIAQCQHTEARKIFFGQELTVIPDSLDLAPEQKAKLISLLESYDTAAETAREDFRVKEIPSKDEIVSHVLKLGKERLEKILSIMRKPGLVIEPASHSVGEMHRKMDANLHYKEQNPACLADEWQSKDQDSAYLERVYRWSESDAKVSTWIVDKFPNAAVVPGQKPGEQRNDEQLRVCQDYYKQNGMELVSDHTYAVALQESLRKYRAALEKGEDDPKQHILDFHGRSQWRRQETEIIFNQEHNSTISEVACGCFDPDNRLVDFHLYSPELRYNFLRGRGAVRLM